MDTPGAFNISPDGAIIIENPMIGESPRWRIFKGVKSGEWVSQLVKDGKEYKHAQLYHKDSKAWILF